MRSLTLLKLKQELKLMASLIRPKRRLFRENQSAYDKGGVFNSELWKNTRQLDQELGRLRFDFRHKHIVYCLLRGRTREQIEKMKEPCGKFCPKNRFCCNKPDEDTITKLLSEYTKLISEETQNAAVHQGSQTLPLLSG